MTNLIAQAPAAKSGAAGFDLGQLDTKADPCADFYQYACGGWRAANPIPADQSRWGRYNEMAELNRTRLRTILEELSDPKNRHNAVEKQVGDYYAACMDEKGVEAKGASVIQPYLKRIAAVSGRKALLAVVADLHADGIGALFNFGAAPDLKNASQVIAEIDQSGISLPDRDYYLKSDPKSVERREKYLEHMNKMFTLLGETPEAAAADAKSVMEVETALAQAYMDRTLRRDPKNLDHKMARADVIKLAPNFELARYFDAIASPAFTEMNVVNPEFFKNINTALESLPLDQWKAYLRWRVLRSSANRMSSAFVEENYRFNNEYLRGTRAMEPRWKRCVASADAQIGEASGKLFVERYFGSEGKAKIRELVNNVMAALEESIRTVDWMGDATRKKAIEKLHAISTRKLGFPETYRDYSAVKVARDDYFGNSIRANRFEQKRDLAKIGKPVDKSEWGMTPPTVNAYYDPQFAEIVFPAGILQPPMFGLAFDDGYSYGAIGRVVGHELTHGFDDEGRKFDAQGNLTDWWTEADAQAFEERASCIEKQYAEYSPVNDDKTGQPMYLNGKLTLGENTADNGGVRMAYLAYMKSLEGKERKIVDGFTPEQRFFLGYAVSRCENVTDQTSRLLVVTDPHSPGKFRLIGAVTNMPEFWKAFSCKPDQPMVRGDKSCKVW
ncbi:MAG: M13 family metallopeptidase [Acidobacteriales bacterium]|nr:M13 family metallopeptidase [Terriglobales bacterium]